MTSSDYIALLYQSLLGRAADPDGLAHHTAELERTGDLRHIVDIFLASDEYIRRTEPPPLPRRHEIGRPLTIVDVGAQTLADEDHIYAPLIRSGLDWRCIGFEPLDARREARLAGEADPRLILHDAFIGDGGRHRFHIVNDDGSSSLLPLNAPFNRDFEHIESLRIVATEDVQTRTLDDMLAAEDEIDFLKFDIQGFESRALQAAKAVLARTNVVHCECFFAPMYQEQGYFADIDRLLRAAGFDFVDFSHLARYRYVAVPRPSRTGERLIWADAVYFRRLDPARDAASSFHAQAAIADLVYRKPGLAQAVLQPLEAETGAAPR